MMRELNREMISHTPEIAWENNLKKIQKTTVGMEYELATCQLIHGHSPCPLSLQQTVI